MNLPNPAQGRCHRCSHCKHQWLSPLVCTQLSTQKNMTPSTLLYLHPDHLSINKWITYECQFLFGLIIISGDHISAAPWPKNRTKKQLKGRTHRSLWFQQLLAVLLTQSVLCQWSHKCTNKVRKSLWCKMPWLQVLEQLTKSPSSLFNIFVCPSRYQRTIM